MSIENSKNKLVLGLPLLANRGLASGVVQELSDVYGYDITRFQYLGSKVAAEARSKDRLLLTHYGSAYLTKDAAGSVSLGDEVPKGVVYLLSLGCTSELWHSAFRALERHLGSNPAAIANRMAIISFDFTGVYIRLIPG